MRRTILVTVFGALTLAACVSTYNVSEDVRQLSLGFTDPRWNGVTVPDGQQCLRFGGREPGTPEIEVGGIPATADALVVEYTDRSWGSVGWHGKIGFNIEPGTTTFVIPSVPGHSFDLPEGFFLIAEHRAPHWDVAGAYLPPCSGAGGLGNSYYATVKAIVKAKSEGKKPLLLAEDVIQMGNTSEH